MGYDEMEGTEKFWIGPKDEEKHTVYQMQSEEMGHHWYQTSDGTSLDPNFSEFSIRLHNPNAKSLSVINTTMAIIPKSQVRAVYKLIGEYLNEIDETETSS